MANILNTTDDQNQHGTSVPQPQQTDNNNQNQNASPYYVPTTKSDAFENPISIQIQNENQAVPESKVEKETIQELSKPAPVPAALKDDQNKQDTVGQVPKQPIPNVVDKETHKERLHTVSKNADSITSLADKEEEDFINKVEEHHLKK